MSCCKHRFPKLSFSLAIHPYYPSLPPGLLDYILHSYRAVLGKFLFVGQHWHIHVKRSIGECQWWICFCFSSSVPHVIRIFLEHLLHVIYWLSTKRSIKRCTCVNKRKNSGSRWALNNNITRCTDGLCQLGTRCWSDSQRQTEGFGLSVTHG